MATPTPEIEKAEPAVAELLPSEPIPDFSDVYFFDEGPSARRPIISASELYRRFQEDEKATERWVRSLRSLAVEGVIQETGIHKDGQFYIEFDLSNVKDLRGSVGCNDFLDEDLARRLKVGEPALIEGDFDCVLNYYVISERSRIIAKRRPVVVSDVPRGYQGKDSPPKLKPSADDVASVAAAKSPSDLVPWLQDPHAEIRRRAVERAAELTEADVQGTVTLLRSALSDRNVLVRRQAAREIARLGPSGAAAAPELAVMLEDAFEPLDGDVESMLAALQALESFGPGAQPALPQLLQLMDEWVIDQEVREQLLRMAPGLGKAGRAAITIMLKDNHWDRDSAVALARMGEEAELLKVLKSTEPLRVISALAGVEALAHRSPATEEQILKLASDSNDFVAAAAAQVLSKRRPTSPEIVASLRNLLKRENHDLRKRTVQALANCDYACEEVVELIIAARGDKVLWVQMEAERAYEKILRSAESSKDAPREEE